MGGVSNSLGWVTTHSSKERMMNYFKDYFERGMLKVYSTDLLDEMKSIVRDNGTIAAAGRGKDDRVIGSALATAAFAEQLQPRLIQNRVTREFNNKDDFKTPEQVAYGRSVSNYLKGIGIDAGNKTNV